MNSDIPYQSLDLSNQNPLKVDDLSVSDSKKTKFAIPNDPKIKLLIILGGITFVLLVLSLIVTAFRSSRPTTNSKPIPNVITTPKPTEVIEDINNIPPDLKTKFDQIDQQNQTNINFPPPQIDPTIGQ